MTLVTRDTNISTKHTKQCRHSNIKQSSEEGFCTILMVGTECVCVCACVLYIEIDDRAQNMYNAEQPIKPLYRNQHPYVIRPGSHTFCIMQVYLARNKTTYNGYGFLFSPSFNINFPIFLVVGCVRFNVHFYYLLCVVLFDYIFFVHNNMWLMNVADLIYEYVQSIRIGWITIHCYIRFLQR